MSSTLHGKASESLHINCKTPQLPDSELKKYILKVKGLIPLVNSYQVVNAKEERKRAKASAPVVLTSAKKATEPKKRTKSRVDSDDFVEIVSSKEPKKTVMQLLFRAYHISCFKLSYYPAWVICCAPSGIAASGIVAS